MITLASVVHSDPEILGGAPVFMGTRVPFARSSTIWVVANPLPSSWRTFRRSVMTKRLRP